MCNNTVGKKQSTDRTLERIFFTDTVALECVARLLHRSACVLTRLTLSSCNGVAADIIHLLQNTPSLTTLAINLSIHTPHAPCRELIAGLTIRPGDSGVGHLCPHLVSFSWGDEKDMMDYPAFVAMVDMLRSRSRNAPGPCQPLEFVEIYLDRLRMRTRGRWTQWTQALVDEGMDVAIANTTQRGGSVVHDWWDGWISISCIECISLEQEILPFCATNIRRKFRK
ncbi:hypothetical protein B0H14DRAFT_2577430 [Mycena olivaceomarginata]|nr:hypothetical protein B0H14DRAFT_2577430 [Mycena olivaceomarginata]